MISQLNTVFPFQHPAVSKCQSSRKSWPFLLMKAKTDSTLIIHKVMTLCINEQLTTLSFFRYSLEFLIINSNFEPKIWKCKNSSYLYQMHTNQSTNQKQLESLLYQTWSCSWCNTKPCELDTIPIICIWLYQLWYTHLNSALLQYNISFNERKPGNVGITVLI